MIAVITSRLSRLITPDEAWLTGLRGVFRKISSDNVRVVIGDATAGSAYVQHLAQRLCIPFEVVAATPYSEKSEGRIPYRDRILLEAADVVYVLGLRNEGNLHRLLRERLSEACEPADISAGLADSMPAGQLSPLRRAPAVILVDIPGLQSDAIRIELCGLGASIWQPTAEQCRPIESRVPKWQVATEDKTAARNDLYFIAPFPNRDGWDFLTHTTRACPGPWPEESFENYADQLFESRPEADHSSLGSLRRILSQRRLTASNRAIRDGHRVVSFTECPLVDLPSLHKFRPHRVRWDFEPFGLCLRRDWLQRRGTLPVQYSDEAGWQSMDEQIRPYFQVAIGDSGTDWSVEREWRHLGDLDLSDLTGDDVLVFVPNAQAAKSLAQVTSWPITLWPETTSTME